MPLYEYHCPRCDSTFEKRVSMQDRSGDQNCPRCQQAAARVEMSAVAVQVAGGSPSGGFDPGPAMGGGCCGGVCGGHGPN